MIQDHHLPPATPLPFQRPAAIHGDCMEILPLLLDHSFDMILCDLPYQMTRNAWDCSLPLEDYILIDDSLLTLSELNQMLWVPGRRNKVFMSRNFQTLMNMTMREIAAFWNSHRKPGLWSQYKRIIRMNGVIVLFGAGMFACELMRTGRDIWRYNLVWEKNHPTGFLNANRRPLRKHEWILVFYRKLPSYHPQKTNGHKRKVSTAYHKRNVKRTSNYGAYVLSSYDSTERYPTSIWRFPSDKEQNAFHPTQKPLKLCETLIKTYTDDYKPEDPESKTAVVLDHCAGSFTTAVACDNLLRSWVAIEKDPEYFEKGLQRVNDNRRMLGMNSVERSAAIKM